MFSGVLLEKPQKDLLAQLVETERSAPEDRRTTWIVLQRMSAKATFLYDGAKNGHVYGHLRDLDELAAVGFVAVSWSGQNRTFHVTPLGFKYYEYLMSEAAPAETLEAKVQQYLSSAEFSSEYREAFAKWSQAQTLLWASDSQAQHTTIGHLCREAMQLFCDALVLKHKPVGVEADKAKTAARLRSVLAARRGNLGKAEIAFLEALVPYWGTVSDLAQRQEHGAQRDGEALFWEDSRRLVFQTCIVMYEIHRALQRGANT